MFSTFLCLQDTAKRSPQWMRMMLLDIKPCLCQFSPHCHHRETKMTGTLSHNSKPLGQSVWGRVGKVVPERALLLQTRLWQEERCCGIPPHAIWEWGDKVTANSRRACGSICTSQSRQAALDSLREDSCMMGTSPGNTTINCRLITKDQLVSIPHCPAPRLRGIKPRLFFLCYLI